MGSVEVLEHDGAAILDVLLLRQGVLPLGSLGLVLVNLSLCRIEALPSGGCGLRDLNHALGSGVARPVLLAELVEKEVESGSPPLGSVGILFLLLPAALGELDLLLGLGHFFRELCDLLDGLLLRRRPCLGLLLRGLLRPPPVLLLWLPRDSLNGLELALDWQEESVHAARQTARQTARDLARREALDYHLILGPDHRLRLVAEGLAA